jgi:hypothetical protein
MIGLPRKASILARTALASGLAAGLAALAGCGGDDIAPPTPAPTATPSPGPTPTPGAPAADCPADFANGGVIADKRNCILPGQIIRNLTVPRRAGTIYSLSGRVDVGRDIGGDGQASGGIPTTLTIEPGVVIFGSGGLDYLVVNRGSRLQAAGTAAAPIIFTSRANVESLATDTSQGQWGGVIMLGRAPISDCLGGVSGGSANCEQTYEGLASTLYGGALATDSSGTLQYVQIRYAGFELAPSQEINGLTLAGVGSGTVVDHIQVHNSADDGIEIFGGRANARYLVLTGSDDDSLDTDQGYQGFIQFVLAVQRPGGQSGDDMIEADSEGAEDSLPRQWTRLANATLIQRSTRASSAVLLRGGTDYSLVDSVVVTPRACIDIDGAATARAADGALQDQGPPLFRSVALTCDAGAYLNDGEVGVSAIQALFESAVFNNNPALASSLRADFSNGPNETAVVAFNAATLGAFLATTSYIGAIKDANDLWYRGWTCDSATAALGSAAGCDRVQYR